MNIRHGAYNKLGGLSVKVLEDVEVLILWVLDVVTGIVSWEMKHCVLDGYSCLVDLEGSSREPSGCHEVGEG